MLPNSEVFLFQDRVLPVRRIFVFPRHGLAVQFIPRSQRQCPDEYSHHAMSMGCTPDWYARDEVVTLGGSGI